MVQAWVHYGIRRQLSTLQKGKGGEVKLKFEGSDLEIRVSREMDFVRPNFDSLNFECSLAAQQPKLACSVADHLHHA